MSALVKLTHVKNISLIIFINFKNYYKSNMLGNQLFVKVLHRSWMVQYRIIWKELEMVRHGEDTSGFRWEFQNISHWNKKTDPCTTTKTTTSLPRERGISRRARASLGEGCLSYRVKGGLAVARSRSRVWVVGSPQPSRKGAASSVKLQKQQQCTNIPLSASASTRVTGSSWPPPPFMKITFCWRQPGGKKKN